jgi:diguanylate cyclase
MTDSATADPESLLRDADVALREGKERGRDRVVLFDTAMRKRLLARLAIANEIREALVSDQFELYYQPQVELATGRVTGAEALLRWNHPDRGLLAPGAFLDVAEDTGLIVPIGQWVVQQAGRDAVAFRQVLDAGSVPRIAVNVSPTQLARDDMCGVISAVLEQHDLPVEALGIEVIENVLVDPKGPGVGELERLHAMGVEIALDDFGTGYFSLGNLADLPVDVVKIALPFVAGLETDGASRAVVQAITDLAAGFAMRVVAEGVETEGQAAALLERGVHLGQGYLYARPMPRDDFAAAVSRSGGAADVAAG